MAVKIRLTRTGKKKQPTYRVVVMDGRKPRDGKYIEQIGRYDARQEPSLVEIDNERALDWLHKGAQPTERAQKLLEISGAWAQFRVDKGEIHTIGEHQAKAWPEKVHVVEAAPEAELAEEEAGEEPETSEGLPTSEASAEEAANMVEASAEEAANMVEASAEEAANMVEASAEEAANMVEASAEEATNMVEASAEEAEDTSEGLPEEAGGMDAEPSTAEEVAEPEASTDESGDTEPTSDEAAEESEDE